MALATRWCFTINNPTGNDEVDVCSWKTVANYLVCGKETGESGTPHLQGYVCLATRKRLTALKKMSSKAHWEVARGSDTDNKKYCEKDGDILIEYGEPTDKPHD